ncbi:glycosyltransferase family 2 protein [Acidobacteriota bacterium]
MHSNSSFVHIIVVNHNGSAILEECLNAIQQQTHNSYEIVVVDNGSVDDSVALIQNNYPNIRLITLERNEGYAKAHNIALEQVFKEKPQVIALVNTDVVLHKDWLLSILNFLEESDFDLVQTLILKYEDPKRIDSAGIGVSRSLKFYDRQHGRPVRCLEGNTEIFGPCFAAAALKSHVFQSLRDEHGYLDKTLGSFYEDVDFSFRANSKGYKSALLAQPLCRHRRSHTADSHPFQKYFHLGRNYFLILAKHIPAHILFKSFPPLILERMAFCFRTIGHPRNFFGFTLGSIIGLCRLLSRTIFVNDKRRQIPGKTRLIQKIRKSDYE